MPENKKGEQPTDAVFDEISCYWTEIADAHDTERQVNLAKDTLSASGLVLDMGCGNGRHAVQLSEAGYDVVGLDISVRLLKIAKSKAAKANLKLTLVRADMRFLPFCSNAFMGIVSLDSTLGYFPSENEDLRSLREVARTLAERGIFLLDVYNGEHILMRQGTFRLRDLLFGLARFPQFSALFRWHEFHSFCMLQKRRIKRGEEMLVDTWIFLDKQSRKTYGVRHAVRLYRFAQLQRLLTESRLRVVNVYGDYEREEFSKNSKRLILTAIKT